LIRIRLQRKGRKKRPFYHIVAADSRSPRDGRIIERLGRFDNVSENKFIEIDENLVMYWLNTGAQPTDAVRYLFRNQGLLMKMHLMCWGKSEEEIEAALNAWREKRSEQKKAKMTSRKEKMKEVLAEEDTEYKKLVEARAKEAAAKMKAEREAAELAAREKREAEAAAAAAKEEAKSEATEAASAPGEEAPAEETPAAETPEAEAKEEGAAELESSDKDASA
jgi:ribosomal protein S16